jgi:hypothetical protein
VVAIPVPEAKHAIYATIGATAAGNAQETNAPGTVSAPERGPIESGRRSRLPPAMTSGAANRLATWLPLANVPMAEDAIGAAQGATKLRGNVPPVGGSDDMALFRH